MNQYKLRKDVDELQILAAQVDADVNMLRSITLDGNAYYTKEEVDDVLAHLKAKAEGLPYFYKNSDGDLIVDLPLDSPYSFVLNANYELVVSLPSNTNPFRIDADGNLWFRS